MDVRRYPSGRREDPQRECSSGIDILQVSRRSPGHCAVVSVRTCCPEGGRHGYELSAVDLSTTLNTPVFPFQGMLLLAAWSTNGWLPSGHAMRMALDLGLHRALEKLADGDSGKKRSEEEERDLGKLSFLLLTWY